MNKALNKEIIYQILAVVDEIHCGKVATYGQIARLIGRVLANSDYYGNYPCHRVVNHQGRLVPNFDSQYSLLKGEEIVFKDDNRGDLRKCQWRFNND